MDVENILILGNGFDLAMGRKTSYKDFLDFIKFVYIVKKFPLINDEDSNNVKMVLYGIDYEFKHLDFEIYQNYRNYEDYIRYFLQTFQIFSNKNKDEYPTIIYKFIIQNFDSLNNMLRIELGKNIDKLDTNNIVLGHTKLLNKIKEELLGIKEIKNNYLPKDISSFEYTSEYVKLITNNFFNNQTSKLFNISGNIIILYLIKNKDSLGDNWADIEHNISKLAEAVMDFKNGISNEDSSSRFIQGYAEQFKDYDRDVQIQKISDNLLNSLDNLTDLLEYYLTCQDQFDFGRTPIQKQSTILDELDNNCISNVLTFNYTNTAKALLGVSEENTHFIHGRIDYDRKLSPINTMVFGIEDKNDDIDTDLMPYQKYYQRIVKETGNDYEKFFERKEIEGSKVFDAYPKNIIIFGHSIDPLDKEIFLNCFDLAEKGWYNYKFIVSYYSEQDKRSIIKNLVIILGKSRVIDLTRQNKLVFVQSKDNERMKKELLKEKDIKISKGISFSNNRNE